MLRFILCLWGCAVFLTGCGGADNRGGEDTGFADRGELVAAWAEATRQGKVKQAMIYAGQLSGDIPSVNISTDIEKLCKSNGISPRFLTVGFNGWDVRRWRSAFFFRQTALEITAEIGEGDDKATVAALFEAVSERLASKRMPEGALPWPVAVWREKTGLCDRQAWVLCELAYQLGYDAMIVYLLDPGTTVSPHTICEIRKGDLVWVADPYSGVLLPDTSVAQLASDQVLKQELWPDNERWQRAIDQAAFWLPAYPQDYCLRNQILRDKLVGLLGKECPRFGESPLARLKRYLEHAGGGDQRFQYNLWFYPFRLLAADITRMEAVKQSGR